MIHAIFYTEIESPIGKLTIAATRKGVCWISFGSAETSVTDLKRWGKTWLHSDHVIKEESSLLRDAVFQLSEYFQGLRSDFDLPLEVYGTDFQKSVWEQLRQIPFGQVNSYKEVALALGAPKAVRAVGGANNRNPLSIVVPCHRVIGANGALVGYGGGISIKEYLLNLEGASYKRAR